MEGLSTLIILIIFILLFSYLAWIFDYDKKDILSLQIISMILAIFFGVVLIIHLLTWPFASYNYGKFKAKRDSFEFTLKESRKHGSQFERVSILQQVSKWNETLSEKKYDNNHWLFGQYVDDRIEGLHPIK